MALAVVLSFTRVAHADDAGTPHAAIACEPQAAAGRVRCEVTVEVPAGRIAWADAEILRVPDFASPLKGRIGPKDATERERGRWRLSLALVAKRLGVGLVAARVRLVACDGPAGQETCRPYVLEAQADVRVGP